MISIKLVRFPTQLLGLVLVANESEVTDRHDAMDGVRSFDVSLLLLRSTMAAVVTCANDTSLIRNLP